MCPTNPQLVNLGLADGGRGRNDSFHLLTRTEGSLAGPTVDGGMIRSYGGEGGDPDGEEPIGNAMGLPGCSPPCIAQDVAKTSSASPFTGHCLSRSSVGGA
ncbi:hypothetical protein QQF64_027963 [Cirrhinus molitorella]|uniref:Uncharacterized protein n=1 Tax=Cirrhinus molitorella TaxID=172907 RepID=A0ABR3NDY7_9TELE